MSRKDRESTLLLNLGNRSSLRTRYAPKSPPTIRYSLLVGNIALLRNKRKLRRQFQRRIKKSSARRNHANQGVDNVKWYHDKGCHQAALLPDQIDERKIRNQEDYQR